MSITAKSPNGKFHADTFECTSQCSTCLFAFVCPCIVYAQNQAAITNGSSVKDTIIYTIATAIGFQSCIGAYGRGVVRKTRHIEGSFMTDCLTHLCCTSCALTQERTELIQASLM